MGIKKIYRFLFYKLYRFSKAEEQTVNLTIGFLINVFVFEILHIMLFFLITNKLFNFKFAIYNLKIISLLLLISLSTLNYLVLIKSKKIEKINAYYQRQNRLVWKDNLSFFSYIFVLCLFIITLTWYHQKQ